VKSEESAPKGAVNTSVTLLVQYIGNTFWVNCSHFFVSFSCPRSGSTAVPKRGSADLSRSDELQFAAQVVRLGPVLGAPLEGGRGEPNFSRALLFVQAQRLLSPLKAGGAFVVLP
jgi:hypothetical protein